MTTPTYYRAKRLFDGEHYHENALFMVKAGRFYLLGSSFENTLFENKLPESTLPKNAPVIHLSGLVCAGFIDVQVNGGGGAFFNKNPTRECAEQIATSHSQFGTTAMLPTLITDDITVMQQAANTISELLACPKSTSKKATSVIGIHFEGPHLSSNKKGTHSEAYIRPISEQEWAIYARQDLGIKVVTLAPECVSPDDITRLTQLGVIVCLGHSNADFATTNCALQAGATGFTHLFNAMSAFTSRAPNMVGAALLDAKSWCGLIVDGQHVHPSSAKLAINTKTTGKMMLVTDAMPPVGTNITEFDFFDGRKVYRNGNKLTSSTGELAGSVLDMATAVRNTHALDISLEESVRMATLYPAQFLNQAQQMGQLKNGYVANFVVLNQQLKVTQTYLHGQRVFSLT